MTNLKFFQIENRNHINKIHDFYNLISGASEKLCLKKKRGNISTSEMVEGIDDKI